MLVELLGQFVTQQEVTNRMDGALPSIFSVLSVRDPCYLNSGLPVTVFKCLLFPISAFFLFWEIFLILFSNLSIEFHFCSFIKNEFFKDLFSFFNFSSHLSLKKIKIVPGPVVLELKRSFASPSLEEKSPVVGRAGVWASCCMT